VRCSMRFLLYTLMAVMMLCVADPSVFAKDKESKLPQQYREWLDRDVVYLITRGEKAQFLALTTDEDRDKFIDWFWAIRNPDPGYPLNTFKEEHYKRLAYATDHFGTGKRIPGWASERGRIYILLGPPKQMAPYQGFDRVKTIQIWFYENTNPALPPYFYVLFYKKDLIGDYVTYSPYFNGPQDLVTERGVTDSDAVAMIQRDLGQEVARTSLSLLPDEPVDTNNPRPSMQSDVLMSQLHDLANSSYNVAALQRHAAMLTSVTSRLLVGGGNLGVLTAPLRDNDGDVKLHYLLRLKRAEDFAIGKSSDGSFYFSIEARVQVLDENDKSIFSQERAFKHTLTSEQVEQVKHEIFGYEDWLPLPPGKYHLKFVLSNQVNSVGYTAEANVTVPDRPNEGFAITPLVPFKSAESVQPELSGLVPFSTAGVRFSPMLPTELIYSPATDLQFFYQIWAAPDRPNLGGQALEARYAFGRPGAIGDAKIITDQVAAGQLSASGTLLTGKKIPLGDWSQGSYLLTLSLNSVDGKQQAASSLTFRLLMSTPVDPDWDVFDGDAIAKDVKNGTTEYQRGLCYAAFGNKQQAVYYFRRALDKNPKFEEARSALVNLAFELKDFSEVASIAREIPITSNTQDETILRLADGLDRTGNTKDAIALLQSAIKLRTPTGPVYLTLASYYRRVGDLQAGEDFEKKGQALAKTVTSQPSEPRHE
jgi:GWxTD domain-containing protein